MIIASFTTIPDRLFKDLPKKCIQSILNQEKRPDLILVNVPRISRKGIAYDTEKANALELMDKCVKVNWVEKDYGPITKLMGTLEYIDMNNIKGAQIYLVDDDCQYKPHALKKLDEEKKLLKVKALGYAGRDIIIIDGKIVDTVINACGEKFNMAMCYYKERTPTKIKETTLIETYNGVIYDADLFTPLPSFKKWYAELPQKASFADDIVISAWIHKNGGKTYYLYIDNNVMIHDAEDTPQLNVINVSNDNNLNILKFFYERGELDKAFHHTSYSYSDWLASLLIKALLLLEYYNNMYQIKNIILILVLLIIVYFYRNTLSKLWIKINRTTMKKVR